jgi:hypothetical protein
VCFNDFRLSSTTFKGSSFLMCLASPVLHKMLCGSFSERKAQQLKLDDVDGRVFVKVLELWCGRGNGLEISLHEGHQLASVADRFQITEVLSAVEDALMEQLSLDMCGEVVMWSGGCGMRRLEAQALKLAADRFEEFATTAGFMQMEWEALASVVDDDRLIARNEEAVWEAVVRWMSGAMGNVGRRGVLRKVRFPLMWEEYLRRLVVEVLGYDDGVWMAGLVAEALLAKVARREGSGFDFELLERKAQVSRVAAAGSSRAWTDRAGNCSVRWADMLRVERYSASGLEQGLAGVRAGDTGGYG